MLSLWIWPKVILLSGGHCILNSQDFWFDVECEGVTVHCKQQELKDSTKFVIYIQKRN